MVSSVLLHKVQIENYWKMPVRATIFLISSVAVTVFALQGHVCSCIKSSSVKVTNAKYLSARALSTLFSSFCPFESKDILGIQVVLSEYAEHKITLGLNLRQVY